MENNETEDKNKTLTENMLQVEVTETSERHEFAVKRVTAHNEIILKTKLEIGNLY